MVHNFQVYLNPRWTTNTKTYHMSFTFQQGLQNVKYLIEKKTDDPEFQYMVILLLGNRCVPVCWEQTRYGQNTHVHCTYTTLRQIANVQVLLRLLNDLQHS